MKSIDDAAREFAALFERLGISYAMMGGLAVRLHAIPRPTYDVDFTIAISRDKLPALYAEAEQLGYSIPDAQRGGWIDSVQGLPIVKFHLAVDIRSIDVDMFLSETAFQEKLLSRRQRHSSQEWSAWFVTAEDLILLKLIADRPKDRIDVADILFIQGSLDRSYMSEWARTLGVEARLQAALKAADESTEH